MRVLLLFPMADGQTGPAIKHAFEKLGHTVRAVDAKRSWRNSYNVSIQFKPDLVFCSRTKELTVTIILIKQKFKNAIICMWNVDMRTRIKEWSHLFPLVRLCNYHFVVDTKSIPQWRQINSNTFWLSQGVQNEVYNKPKTITDADRARYACDVSFAGRRESSYLMRRKFLDAVGQMGVNFKLWGTGSAPKVYNEEHNKMVALSKINLGCSAWPENEKYASVRNYKILGAGGFLLELHRRGIHELFPSNTMDCYETSQGIVRKVYYWLKHEKERKEVADRGYTWVHANATYTHRIKQALEYMKL